ncbi:Ig domain-containing protein group 2 domain-containing protein [Psychromonas sp. CNPT3]|uniref:Ig domain-containing protein n=1 Tax=Psychromonas sp. CNPT3 TaxID=314282 RepID=UPI0002C068F8|nr:Ig domain-containing protein [Psychromonas sp. CNPT3]AGH82212.1 Ig domain-containing protein group 2 domain-containing protein [Psychromonas sp. CNPT3]
MKYIAFMFIVLSFVLSGCNDDTGLLSGSSTEVGLKALPEEASIPVGLSQAYKAQAIFDDGHTTDVTTHEELHWISSDENIATIDENGVARGINEGKAWITAQGIYHGETFTVKNSLNVTLIGIESVLINGDSEINAGLSITLTATAILEDKTQHLMSNDGKEVIWTIVSQAGSGAVIDPNTGVLTTTSESIGLIIIEVTGVSHAWEGSITKEIMVKGLEVVKASISSNIDVVTAGLPVLFSGDLFWSDHSTTSVSNDGTMVTWSINPTSEATGSIDPDTGVLSTDSNSNGEITVVMTGTSDAWRESVEKTIRVKKVIVHELNVSSDKDIVDNGETQQFVATLTLSDGSLHITTATGGEVQWSIKSLDETSVDICKGTTIDPNSGILSVSTYCTGAITVQAEGTFNDQLLKSSKKVTVFMRKIDKCGGVVNDMTDGKGTCLKVVVTTDNSLYSAPPSINILKKLGYLQVEGESGGRTYAKLDNENFALVNQMGGNVDGIAGQYDRWCTELKSIMFAGKSTWRRLDYNDLNYIYENKGPLGTKYNWPVFEQSWSDSIDGPGTYSTRNFESGERRDSYPEKQHYGTCVAPE